MLGKKRKQDGLGFMWLTAIVKPASRRLEYSFYLFNDPFGFFSHFSQCTSLLFITFVFAALSIASATMLLSDSVSDDGPNLLGCLIIPSQKQFRVKCYYDIAGNNVEPLSTLWAP